MELWRLLAHLSLPKTGLMSSNRLQPVILTGSTTLQHLWVTRSSVEPSLHGSYFLCFSFGLLPCPVTCNHWEKSGSTFLTLSYHLFIRIGEMPLNSLFSRLSNPSLAPPCAAAAPSCKNNSLKVDK